MSFIGTLIGSILRPLLERHVKNRAPETLVAALENSQSEVADRLRQAADTERNRDVANHIVGIERSSQRRLRSALGEPPLQDGYRGYRLPETATLDDLRHAFDTTRQDTLHLAQALQTNDVDFETKIRHNDLGALSVRAWLAYLDGHAKRESTRLSK
ncbi:hypothetical protein BH24DEI2_BH24DEI2_10610 [soil metagenome]